jgi:hypothetical protein
MASIIAHEVFSEIVEIARSDEPLRKRRARAEKRIAQFKADLKAAFFMSPTRGRLSKTMSSRFAAGIQQSGAATRSTGSLLGRH